MSRIFIALCFSLFASLIHAAVMPMNLSAHQPQVTVTDNLAHHCDEVASNSHDTNTNQPCHGDGYQCCLGLVVIPILSIELSAGSTQAPPLKGSSLVLQPMINFIYKPPKV
ncbi:hypothetical protein [Polynucleobacter necessarius]|uniref:hypothetical protein n=1 Tax=Polynucleobacter necessarius TaxID=576610 RepID=UPI0013B06552|nr:hypothetical protein [Polynucleobacter necessarius]